MLEFYRCPDCSSRSTAYVVPAKDADEHKALHAMIRGGPCSRKAIANSKALNIVQYFDSMGADNR